MVNNLAINTIRVSGIAAINKSNSGHPGIVLGAAPMIHTLFTKHLVYDVNNTEWINRDRFILSAGHGSALLYAQLRLLGLISTKDLKEFRQLNSLTPGHPEFNLTKGIEATTGPLGQGIAMAVGIAIAEAHLHSKFPEINHFTYVICGDGDIQEGVAQEAISLAGKQKLNKLIIMHDSNDIQLDSEVFKTFKEDLKKRFTSVGWNYILVKKNCVKFIDKALIEAKKSDKPTFIEIKTIIGEGSTNQGTNLVHGSPLGKDIEKVKEYLNWKDEEFFIPQKVKELYKKTIISRGNKNFKNFKKSKNLKKFLKENKININLNIEKNIATRLSSSEVIKYLNKNTENWIGGSADLSCSTKAFGGEGDFSPENRKGRNILFGVREFSMACIANGIALHSNFKPFVSTFFVFSDYLKPALRLSAIMKLPVTYIMTHDSIFVGEDGPTHQPIEQTAMIRSTPNVKFLRPADEKEVIGSYELAYNSEEGPTVIALTRQAIKSKKEINKESFKKGMYKVVNNNSEWTLASSGSELSNAIEIARELKINAVSISHWKGKPKWDVSKCITIEAATTFGMQKYGKYNIGINTFGESAPGEKVYNYFKLNKESIIKKIKKILK